MLFLKGINNVVGIYGFKGSGKTTALTLFAWLAKHFNHKKVLSNYSMDFMDGFLSGRDMIMLSKSLDNTWIAVDELHEYADSRNSNTLQNKRVADFFLQSRHFLCDIYYSTQYKDQCDKRIRRITDIDIVCENLFMDSDNDGDDDLFKLIVKDRRMPNTNPKELVFYAKPIFDLYDSTERINPFVFSKKEEELWKEKVSKE